MIRTGIDIYVSGRLQAEIETDARISHASYKRQRSSKGVINPFMCNDWHYTSLKENATWLAGA
jgi:hypothetical protein